MIKQIFDELEATASLNEKQAILTRHKDNELLKRVLAAALNPYVNYYIRKIPDYTPMKEGLGIGEFIDHLPALSTRKVTGNAAIQYLTDILSFLAADDAVIAERIIKKDLRCGVSDSITNKVWKNLIPTYPCLLAQPGDEKHLSKVVWPAGSQLKSDGIRINFLCNNGDIVSRGRSGKEVPFHGLLDKVFAKLEEQYGGPCVFDGELIVEDEDGSVMARAKGNGLLNKAIKGTITEDEAKKIRVQIWDVIPYDDFFAGYCDQPYSERKQKLNAAFDAIAKTGEDLFYDKLRGGQPLVANMETRMVNTIEEAREHFLELRAQGFEGTILKNMKGLWEDKRSNDLVKMKAEEEADLEIIGWNKGAVGTKLENKMGSLICASSDRSIVVSISGFPDALRDEITDHIDAWIGRIVTVRYNERIKSKTSKVESLFLPRFVCLREDKDVANSAAEII